MLLTPLPGGRDNLLKNLEFVKRELGNAKTSHSSVTDKHKAYLDAIGGGARMLRGQVRPTDIDELLHSRRYWALLDMTLAENPPSTVVSDLLSLEIDDRMVELDATIATTRQAFDRWSVTAGQLVLPDTNFYLHNPNVLENIDFPTILGTENSITVLFPLVVIEELDRESVAETKPGARPR